MLLKIRIYLLNFTLNFCDFHFVCYNLLNSRYKFVFVICNSQQFQRFRTFISVYSVKFIDVVLI